MNAQTNIISFRAITVQKQARYADTVSKIASVARKLVSGGYAPRSHRPSCLFSGHSPANLRGERATDSLYNRKGSRNTYHQQTQHANPEPPPAAPATTTAQYNVPKHSSSSSWDQSMTWDFLMRDEANRNSGSLPAANLEPHDHALGAHMSGDDWMANTVRYSLVQSCCPDVSWPVYGSRTQSLLVTQPLVLFLVCSC